MNEIPESVRNFYAIAGYIVLSYEDCGDHVKIKTKPDPDSAHQAAWVPEKITKTRDDSL